MSEFIYKTNKTRVYGNGKSYQCNNIVTAKELCNTLNSYHNTSTKYTEIEKKLDKVQKTIIQLQLTTGILGEELETLKEELQ